MDDLKDLLKAKKNLKTLIISLILLVALPAGLYLSQNQQIFKPKAFDLSGSSVTILNKDTGATISDTTINTHEVKLRIQYQAPNASLPNQSIQEKLSETKENFSLVKKAYAQSDCPLTHCSEYDWPEGYCTDYGASPGWTCNYNPNNCGPTGDGCFQNGGVPNCNGGQQALGPCEPNQYNTCYQYNGSQPYRYTTYNGSTNCLPMPFTAQCTIDACEGDATCISNTCQEPQPCNATPDCNGTVCELPGSNECGTGSRECTLTTRNGSYNCTPATIEQTGCIVGCGFGTSCVNGQCEEPTPTCVDVNPAIIVVPNSLQISEGQTKNFTIQITNRNTGTCTAEPFRLFSDTLGIDQTLSLSPGQPYPISGTIEYPDSDPPSWDPVNHIIYLHQADKDPDDPSVVSVGLLNVQYLRTIDCSIPDQTACWIGAQCSNSNNAAADASCRNTHQVDGSTCHDTNDGPYGDGCSQGYPREYRIREGGQERVGIFAGATSVNNVPWTLSPGNGSKRVYVDFWLNNERVLGDFDIVNVEAGTISGTDLVVGSVSSVNATTLTTQPVQIKADIQNQGSTAVTGTFRVNLTFPGTPGLAGQTYNINGLGANGITTITFPTNNIMPTAGNYNYTVTVDDNGLIPEAIENNNTTNGILIVSSDGTGTNLDLGITAEPNCELNNNVNARRVTLNWRLLNGANSYKVERNGQVITTTQAQTGLSTTSFIYADFPGTGTFNYVVKAFSGGGGSGTLLSTSSTVPITVNSCTGGGTNLNLTVTPGSTCLDNLRKVTLNWQVISGANSFTVDRNGQRLPNLVLGLNPGQTTYTHDDYPGTGPFSYVVKAYSNTTGTGSVLSTSQSVSATVNSCNGVSPAPSVGGCVSLPGYFQCPSVAPSVPASAANGGRVCPVLGDATNPCDGLPITISDYQVFRSEYLIEVAGGTSARRADFNPQVSIGVTITDFNIWKTAYLNSL